MMASESPRRHGGPEPALAALLFVAFVCLLGPWWSVYELSTDEGINLMKGALVANGHRLYAEIWSDQPPIFTLVLAGLHRLRAFDVAAARALVLAFTSLLVAALFGVVRRSEGSLAAWLAVAILASAELFQLFSVTVAIGLPAIALLVAALDRAYAGAAHGQRWSRWLAGVLLALSAHTKLFTLAAVPALLATAWLPVAQRGVVARPPRRVRATLDLLVPAAVTFAVVALVAGGSFWEQLVAPHVRARAVFESYGGGAMLAGELWRRAAFATAMGVLGCLCARPWRRPARWIPLLWLGVATPMLIVHRPLWNHHVLLVLVPLAWMGGILAGASRVAVEDGGGGSWSSRRRAIRVAILIVIACGAAMRTGVSTRAAFWRAPAPEDLAAREGLARFAPISAWVVTDRPIDAYRARVLVPPPVAVYSDKRRQTGNLTPDQVIAALRRFRPEQIYLRRFEPEADLLRLVSRDYVRVSVGGARHHYLSHRVAVSGALMLTAGDLLSRSPNGALGGTVELSTGRRLDRPSSSHTLPPTALVVRPPGSAQEVGACLLRFAELARLPQLERAAIAVAEALACAQSEPGGWDAIAEIDSACRAAPGHRSDSRRPAMRLDDGATQSALAFLLDVRSELLDEDVRPPSWLDDAVRRGLDALLAAQLPAGGWPQRFPPVGGPNYAGYSTLNDGATTDAIRVLLRAGRELAHEPYREAAVRAGDFLLRVQRGGPQAAWAQQYDEALRPAAARAFEPAAYASLETAYAMDALLDLHLETGEPRFREALPRARAWLERSQIGTRRWARLYALGSNLPVYGDRDRNARASLAELSPERRAGYRWEGGAETFPEIALVLRRLDALERGGAAAVRRLDAAEAQRGLLSELATARARPDPARAEALVATALAEGRWSESGWLSSRTFVESCVTLLDAVAARTTDRSTAAASSRRRAR